VPDLQGNDDEAMHDREIHVKRKDKNKYPMGLHQLPLR
jgi:hypothetical protein